MQLEANGGFLVVGERHVLRYNLYFQKVTLAATTKSRKTSLETGRPEAFMMLQEQDGGSLDRGNSGHGSKRIDLKYHQQVEFIWSHLTLFSPTLHQADEETGAQGNNVESPSISGRTTTLIRLLIFSLKHVPLYHTYLPFFFFLGAHAFISLTQF